MAAAQRAAANAAMDAALATIVADIPGWVANGGKTPNLVRSILAALCAADPSAARYIERRFGSSLLAEVALTITAGDTAP